MPAGDTIERLAELPGIGHERELHPMRALHCQMLSERRRGDAQNWEAHR